MKVTYEIDTLDPNQAMEKRQIDQAGNMALVLWEMTFNVRRTVNAEIDEKVSQGYRVNAEDALSMVFQHFNELMASHGINIEELNN